MFTNAVPSNLIDQNMNPLLTNVVGVPVFQSARQRHATSLDWASKKSRGRGGPGWKREAKERGIRRLEL